MTYEILIEGGFTGIAKKYQGKIELTPTETRQLVHILNKKDMSTAPQLRDGQTYHVSLVENTKVYSAVFDDKNMPKEIRTFLDRAKRNG